MIARGIKIQLGAFLVIAIGAMSYAGASVVLPSAVTPTFTVKAEFKDAGGTFKQGEVTYRGVNIGRIGSVKLRPDGVEVSLVIEKKTAPIPESTLAVVADKSAVGEQYVDLQPQSDSGPYLHAGSVIPQSHTRIPVAINSLIVDLDKTLKGINLNDLHVVVDELAKGFSNTADPVQKLIAASDGFTHSLQDSLPDTIKLINSGRVNLQTAHDTEGQLRQFAQGLSALSQQLVTSDPDLRGVVDKGIVASQQLGSFLEGVQPDLYPLLGNLTTASAIGAARIPGLKQTLLMLPVAGGRLHLAFHDSQLYTPLTVGEDLTPKCTYPAKRRLPTDTSKVAPQTNYYCPDDKGATTPRGARYAPRPPGDTTAGPGSDNGGPVVTPTSDTSVATTLGTYDPVTRLASTASGQYFTVGEDTGLSDELRQELGDRSWMSLLLSLISRS